MRRLIAALMLVSAPAAAQTSTDELAQSLVDAGSPGAVVMWGDGDTTLISVAGVRAEGTDVAIELGDLWHIGSNTKAMTAILVARLVEDGVVSWDDTIGQHLGDRIEGIRPEFAEATFIDLLAHRTGLPANAGLMTLISLAGTDAARDARADRIVYAEAVLTRNPAGEPGEFLYSNSGYIVAGAMLEAATGESWEELITREVFHPLGMDSAGFGPPGTAGEVDQPRGHRAGLFGGLNAMDPESGQSDNPPALGPAGRVHVSMPDYARFLRTVLDGAKGRDGDYLSAESWERLLTPVGDNYALGWGINGGALVHAGSNTMWYLQAVVWPDTDRFAVVAVNEARTQRIQPEIGRVISTLSNGR